MLEERKTIVKEFGMKDKEEKCDKILIQIQNLKDQKQSDAK